jgi:alkanesulfonate monooxygenase SsuD/methylene tetrahydromethanopterin reductase-like flavin-dependent oxidoreductase (luciferase family)
LIRKILQRWAGRWVAGIPGFPSAGDRLAMLEEGVEIMRQAWLEGVAHYAGEHYQVDGALCHPKPLQEGGIPFWIAGGGEKKTLRIAAKRASYTNFDGTADVFERKSLILAEHCKDLGRDFDEIVRSANYNVVIGRNQAEIDDRLGEIENRFRPYLAPDGLAKAMGNFRDGPMVGTPEQIVEKLQAMQRLGMTYAITYFAEAATDRSGVELFANEVIPALAG